MPEEIKSDETVVASNVEAVLLEAPEQPSKEAETPTKEEPQKETPTSEAVSEEEPTVVVDGEKIPLSDIKKWKEDVANDSKWKNKNRLESEELNRRRSELQQAELLAATLKQRPDIMQQLLTPQPKRDFEAESKQIYLQEPDRTLYPSEWAQWSVEKDKLNLLWQKSLIQEQSTKDLAQQSAFTHNTEIDLAGKAAYVDTKKVSESEYRDMVDWIARNVRATDGKYPKNSYDLAYRSLHEERWLSEKTLERTQKAISPIVKAKTRSSVGDAGTKSAEFQPTPEEDEDALFRDTVKSKTKKWMSIPA